MSWPLWDWVVRLTHWFFPIGIAFMWWSGEQGHYQWHSWMGYGLLVAVGTRIAWGFIGSRPARFRHFLRGPGAIKQYLTGRLPASEGHNPLGGWATLVLLALILVQGVTGLFTADDIMFEGPLAYWGGDWSGPMAELHEVNWTVLQIAVVLHLGAVLWHQLYLGEPLIQAMLRGRALGRSASVPPRPQWLGVLVAASFAAALGLVLAVAPEAPSFY